MASDEVDEWEQAELNLNSLKLESRQTSQSSVVFPPHLMHRPIEQEINFFPDHAASNLPPSLIVPSSMTIEQKIGLIDPVLINALNNPAERMNALNIENMVMKFALSNEQAKEIPPLFNSFRRLLIYRCADRFKIDHNTSEYTNEKGDHGILLVKTSATAVPSPLLVDIDVALTSSAPPFTESGHPSPYGGTPVGYMQPPVAIYNKPAGSGSPAEIYGQGPYANYGSSTNPNLVQTMPPHPVKRLTVMKRSTVSVDGQEKVSVTGRQQVSGVPDKGKAYAEARARIFGDQEDGEAPSPAPSLGQESALPASTADSTQGTGSQIPSSYNSEQNSSEHSPVSSRDATPQLPAAAAASRGSSGSSPITVDKAVAYAQYNYSNKKNPRQVASLPPQQPQRERGKPTGRGVGATNRQLQPADQTSTPPSDKSPVSFSREESCGSLGSIEGEEKRTTAAGDSDANSMGSGGFHNAGSGTGVSNSVDNLGGSNHNNNSGYRKKLVDPGKWKDVKYISRDKDAEKSDPDFARRSVVTMVSVQQEVPQQPPLYPMGIHQLQQAQPQYRNSSPVTPLSGGISYGSPPSATTAYRVESITPVSGGYVYTTATGQQIFSTVAPAGVIASTVPPNQNFGGQPNQVIVDTRAAPQQYAFSNQPYAMQSSSNWNAAAPAVPMPTAPPAMMPMYYPPQQPMESGGPVYSTQHPYQSRYNNSGSNNNNGNYLAGSQYSAPQSLPPSNSGAGNTSSSVPPGYYPANSGQGPPSTAPTKLVMVKQRK